MPLLFAFCNNTQVENMFSTKSGFEHHSPVAQLALIFLLVINQLWFGGTLDDWKKKLIGKLSLINLPRQNIWWKSSGFCENLFSNVTAAHTSIFFNLRSQKYWNLKMQIQIVLSFHKSWWNWFQYFCEGRLDKKTMYEQLSLLRTNSHKILKIFIKCS